MAYSSNHPALAGTPPEEGKAPQWMLGEVAGGLQRLMLLALPGTPAAEVIEGTARAWADALWHAPRSWDRDLDAPRIAAALSPLSHITKARKKKNKDKILTEEGHLRRLLSVQAGKDDVEVGSTRIYAGTHQFGARRGAYRATTRGAPIPWGDILARPFLGVSDGDKKTILKIIQKHLKKSI